MKIEQIDTKSLLPYSGNARTHSAEQIAAIAASIRAYGFNSPVLIAEDNGIIAGHGRVLAAIKIGLDTVPCIRLSHLSDEQRKAYIIADNRAYELGQWNQTALDAELQALATSLDYSDADISRLFTIVQPAFTLSETPIADLKPHNRNYKKHPPDQIEQLAASISEHGIVRNIVTASDGTILIGHGVVQALQKLKRTTAPVLRLSIASDSLQALKLLAAENEISHLAEIDDRALSEVLREVLEGDSLLGTGYDESMLANLIYVTRPASEVKDKNESAEWVGMPEFDPAEKTLKLTVAFDNEEDREDFLKQCGLTTVKKEARGWLTHYPEQGRDDLTSVRIE